MASTAQRPTPELTPLSGELLTGLHVACRHGMPVTHTHGSGFCYRRRTPEKEPLYQVLAEHLETFVERTRSSDRQLPANVEKELRAYLECGILAHGFLRVRCEDCTEDRVVAFSCQRRSFCPSCMGRRMVDTAARLTDEVLPRVPVRQWVLSLPYEIRYRLAWDGELVGAVLAVFLRVVYGWYRVQARAQGYEHSRCGSVTFVQRFGSSLNLNPHAHVLMLDGVYVESEAGPEFVAAPTLSDDDVQQIVETTAQRVVRLLQRRGLLEQGHVDPLWEQEPLLATITAASIQGQVATGERAGQPVRRRLLDPQEGIRTGPLCFSSRGFSLHAATRVPAADRTRLERLCRYVNRPPLAAGRLQILDADRVAFNLKTVWSDGTYRIELSPQELIEKLAALVPPRRLNLVRYHGVLAPNAADRAQIVPGPEQEVQDPQALPGRGSEPTPAQRRHRLSWSTLLARVFRFDVTICPACGGHMSIVAALTEPRSIARYLKGVGLPSRAPPIAPARPHPQPELDFAA